jgi:hypothetical protein
MSSCSTISPLINNRRFARQLRFPRNAGIQFVHGIPIGPAAQFPVRPETDLRGGYWVILIALAFGLAILVVTQRCARKYLSWWRERRVS